MEIKEYKEYYGQVQVQRPGFDIDAVTPMGLKSLTLIVDVTPFPALPRF